MNTAWLLSALYEANPLIPIELVARDFFPHLDKRKFTQKLNEGTITLPVVRLDPSSQKGALAIHVDDLASYIDRRREVATKELEDLQRAFGVSPGRLYVGDRSPNEWPE